MAIDAPIYSGHSGSPVFDAGGRVVGVIFAAAAASDGRGRTGYAVPSIVLYRFLTQDPP